MKREVRVFKGAQVRAAAEKPGVDGYAAVFNQTAELYSFSGFTVREVIKPGAFARAIREKQDVRCLFNHDDNIVLGRTKSGTLRLSEDQHGLHFDCDTPDTQAARDARTLIERGDVDQCSFGFIVKKQTRRENDLGEGKVEIIREIEDVDLFDVSPVTYPAYQGTECEARELRAMFPDGVPDDLPQPKSTRNADCECDCPECEDGDCANCSDTECDDDNCEGGGERCKHSARSHKPGQTPSAPPPEEKPDAAAVAAAAAAATAAEAEQREIQARQDRLRVVKATV